MTRVDATSEQHYKNPGVGATVGGVLAGWMVKGITKTPSQFASSSIIKKMKNISNSLSSDEFIQVENAIKETVKSSGLKEKGVEIIKATGENASEISKIMAKEVDNGILKHFPNKIKEQIGTIFSSQVKSGNNACYTFVSKKIIMPEKELGLALFHEAGHAMNANLSYIGKALQKCRGLALLSMPIGLIALWKTKKAPGEKPKNKLDKVTTFIKENAGKLTFAAFLPTLIEEGLATLKGNKAAKNLLNPDLARKVAKTNALGFSTYLILIVLSGLGIYLGTKVKDAIAKPKPVKDK